MKSQTDPDTLQVKVKRHMRQKRHRSGFLDPKDPEAETDGSFVREGQTETVEQKDKTCWLKGQEPH